MDERTLTVQRSYDRAIAALRELSLGLVGDEVAELRRLIGIPADPKAAAILVDALRMELFVLVETGRDTGRALDVVDELEHAGDPHLPRFLSALALGWRYELLGDMAAAFAYRMTVLRQEALVEELGAKPQWGFADRVVAKQLVDGLGDLVRCLRVLRPPEGPMGRERHAFVRRLAHGPILERLVDHGDMSSWSRRRTLTRLAFEAADRGELEQSGQLLDRADAALEDHERDSPLASLDGPLIRLERHYVENGGDPDGELTARLLSEARSTFQRHGFVRRLRELERLSGVIDHHRRLVTGL